jgi:hypothetical protein
MKSPSTLMRGALVSTVMLIAVSLWLLGLLTSPNTSPKTRQQRQFLEHYIQDNAPNLKETRRLAEIYWRRYPDVSSDTHFGRSGIMGIYGARAHYDQHGKIEGRKWGD